MVVMVEGGGRGRAGGADSQQFQRRSTYPLLPLPPSKKKKKKEKRKKFICLCSKVNLLTTLLCIVSFRQIKI